MNLPGDFIYGKSNQLYGALLRTEYYRGSELVSVVENSYSAKKIENQQIQILVPERHIVTGWKEFEESGYSGKYSVFTTHRENLDIDTYRQLDKEVIKRYYTSGGKRHIFSTEKRYAYDYDFLDPGFSLKPRRVETMRSDSTAVVDIYDYLLNYPAILSYHKRTEEKTTWKAVFFLIRVLAFRRKCSRVRTSRRTFGTKWFTAAMTHPATLSR